MKKRVLILCTGNSCRSQLAEALWRHEGGNAYEVASAGIAPKGIHSLTLRVLEESSVATTGLRSKSVAELAGKEFDLIVTVCDHARETCPLWPEHVQQEHWPFEDPAAAQGTKEEVLRVFRVVRDAIRLRIRSYLRLASTNES